MILGTGLGGVGTLNDGFSTNALRGPDRISPFLIPMGIPNVGAGQIAITYGMTGPNFATVSACATGGHAVGESYETIRRDDADIMLAGGSEACIFEVLIGGFAAMRALSTRNDDPAAASRPFDTGRDGFVVGEGAGVLVLEELEHARGPRRDPARRAGRLRGDRRRVAHHAAGAGRDGSGPRGETRSREGRARTRGGPARQCPCHLHTRGRQGRAAGHQDDLRRSCRRRSRSRRTSRCSVTRSGPRAPSRRSPRSWPSATAACRRRST